MRASALAIASLLTCTLGTPALGFPFFGTSVDSLCTAGGLVPPLPFNPNGGDPNDPNQADCGLCHTNALDPGGLSQDGKTFKDSGFSDVSPFCQAALPNQPPDFVPIGAQTATVGSELVVLVQASDPDGDAVSLSISNPPLGHLFDAVGGMGTFRWTPVAGQEGLHGVTFHATDDGVPAAGAMIEVQITVGAPVNRPPVLQAVGDQSVDPGMTLSFALSASDPDGDALFYSFEPALPGATLLGNVFEWTPSIADIGNHQVTFTATDDGVPPLADSDAPVITVGAVNRPPVLDRIGNRVATVGQSLVVPISASDADEDALLIDCLGLPADAAFADDGSGGAEIRWTPVAPGSFDVTCVVTDDGAPPESAEETFTLSAREEPSGDGPVLNAARWVDGKRLFVSGETSGIDGRHVEIALHAILDDGTAVRLGSKKRKANRPFRMGVGPFLAPCVVAASAGGVMGPAVDVQDASPRCDELVLTRARAKLQCDGDLALSGRRGPQGGLVIVLDPASGAELAAAPAMGRVGAFSVEEPIDGLPTRLDLAVEIDGLRWRADRQVRVKFDECFDEDSDGDSDDADSDSDSDGDSDGKDEPQEPDPSLN